MPYRVVEFVETPNPQALKCVLDKSPAPDQPRSYFNAAAAESDPVAARLFAVPGVTNVLIHDGWITVSKAPEASWKSVKAGVRKALEDVPG